MKKTDVGSEPMRKTDVGDERPAIIKPETTITKPEVLGPEGDIFRAERNWQRYQQTLVEKCRACVFRDCCADSRVGSLAAVEKPSCFRPLWVPEKGRGKGGRRKPRKGRR